ncbi:tudor domain-containing protein 7-like [Nematostella vectensis]|uniref:tudor domain-containing protein 7-like n=1 Tax=Nematostella vectensis TaxID=45351 RepID=UPI002076E895|nr:tudor domain-containing protein 7-like [Nematostella vectensis]
MEEMKEKTERMLRAVLISAPRGIPIYKLDKEYKSITFEPIPFKKCGYPSLEAFLRASPKVATIQTDRDGEIIVKGVASEADQHVAKLIAKQKKPKLKKSAFKKPFRRPSTNTYPKPMYTPSKFGPKRAIPRSVTVSAVGALDFSQQAKRRVTFTAQGNAQKPKFVPPRMQKLGGGRSSGISIPQGTQITATLTNGGTTRRTVSLVGETSSIDSTVLEKVQQLLASKPNGIFEKRLPKEYQLKYNEELPSHVVAQLKNMPDIARFEEPIMGTLIFYPCKAKPKEEEKPPPKGGSVKTVELFYLTSRMPDIGTTVEVYVSHINNLDDFYVQLKSFEDKLAELQDLLMKDCEVSSTILQPAKDMFCVARFTEDDAWYRAQIQECITNRDTTTVKVLYVDYGNTEYLPSTRLRHLLEKHAALPKMAIHCTLDGVESFKASKAVQEKCLELFRQNTADVPMKIKVQQRCGDLLHITFDSLEDALCNMLQGTKISPPPVETASTAVATPSEPPLTAGPSLPGKKVPLPSGNGVKSALSVLPGNGQPHSPSGAEEQPSDSTPAEPKRSTPRPFLRSRSNQKEQGAPKLPEKVMVPKDQVDDFIDIYVSNIQSTENISVQLVGEEFSSKLEAMEFSMESYFEDRSDEPYQPKTGDLCAIRTNLIHEKEQWYRVKVLSINDTKAKLEFVDYGDIRHAPVQDLKGLPPRFYELPLQAITVSLYAVPRSKKPEVLEKLNHMLLAKQFVALTFDRTGETTPVELFNTADGLDLNLNDIVRRLILPDEDLKPSLPKVNQQTEVAIVYASESGSLFVQVPGPGLNRLEELMTDITDHYSKTTKAAEFIAKPHVGKICCARSSDGSWYRALVNQLFQSERKVKVRYVDYGHEEVIPSASLREPTKANEHVSTLPFQAAEVRLAGLKGSLSTEQRDRLMELVASNECALLQMVKCKDVPLVNIFLPTDEEGNMEDVLDLIFDQEEPSTAQDDSHTTDNSSIQDSEGATDKDSSQDDELDDEPFPPVTLSRPYEDITVAVITDPSNFTFQPLKLLKDFEEVMGKMASHYNSSKESLVSPRQGDLCAAKNSDGVYYRAMIKAVLSPNQYCVRFLDYGDFAILQSSALQILRDEYKQVPCLALPGSLADVHGVGESGEWTEEAIARFQELTNFKTVVCSVEAEKYTVSFGEEYKIPLSIFDTKDRKDLNIADLLVEEGLARRTEN